MFFRYSIYLANISGWFQASVVFFCKFISIDLTDDDLGSFPLILLLFFVSLPSSSKSHKPFVVFERTGTGILSKRLNRI